MRISDWSSDVCASDLLVHRVDRQDLAEDVARVLRDPREILVGHRQISEQLGLGESRRLARIELPTGAQRHGIDQPRPLVRKAGVGITASDDRRGHAVVGLPGHKLLRPRRATGCDRSEEHTSELQSLMRISYAVFCLKNKNEQQYQL